MKKSVMMLMVVLSIVLLSACAEKETEIPQTQESNEVSPSTTAIDDSTLSMTQTEDNMTESDPEKETNVISVEMATAYLDIVNSLIAEYGHGAINPTEFDGQNIMQGTAIVRLIDFDHNSVPELYIAYGQSSDLWVSTQVVYTYQNGNVIQLMPPTGISNPGTDVSPETCFLYKDDKTYLVISADEGEQNDYYSIHEGEWTSLFHYEIFDDDSGVGNLNGESASFDEIIESMQEFESGGSMEVIHYYYPVEEEQLEKTTDTISLLEEIANQGGSN